MKKLLILVLIACAGYYGYQHYLQPKAEPYDVAIMYSLSYCGACKQMARDLRSAGIDFVEYYVDKDNERSLELQEKLKTHKIRGNILMPVIDLGDVFLPNRPSLAEVAKYFE